jgi:uncharacterized Zn finger protein (UPF0148 family)
MLLIRCSECGRQLQAHDSCFGMSVACPVCKATMHIPVVTSESADETAIAPVERSESTRAVSSNEESVREGRPLIDEPADHLDHSPTSRLEFAGTVEGWAGLVIAVLSWLYACRPIGPMVGMPVEAFLRDIIPLAPTIIGLALAVGGIRHGDSGGKTAGRWAMALLMPLTALFVFGNIRRLFFA